jgi:hypothetical protein|tara:strand:- start:2682 stop:2837 length:156 start_codon:yes stop_codon:yes gene_type:complete
MRGSINIFKRRYSCQKKPRRAKNQPKNQLKVKNQKNLMFVSFVKKGCKNGK